MHKSTPAVVFRLGVPESWLLGSELESPASDRPRGIGGWVGTGSLDWIVYRANLSRLGIRWGGWIGAHFLDTNPQMHRPSDTSMTAIIF